MTKNLENLQVKKFIFWILHKGRPSYRSLQPSKENIQHFKTRNFLIFFYFCGSFLLPSWIRIRISKLQKKPSAFKRKHPALQNMKFLNFFQFLWVISALLDPYPELQATEEAFSTQKRTSSTSKHEISWFFSLFLWILFAGTSSYRRSLQHSKENIQHFKTLNF